MVTRCSMKNQDMQGPYPFYRWTDFFAIMYPYFFWLKIGRNVVSYRSPHFPSLPREIWAENPAYSFTNVLAWIDNRMRHVSTSHRAETSHPNWILESPLGCVAGWTKLPEDLQGPVKFQQQITKCSWSMPAALQSLKWRQPLQHSIAFFITSR